MDAIARFADWASDLSADELPDDVERLTRAEVANNAAAALDGYRGDGADRVALLLASAGEGPCSAPGAEGLDPASACFVNATCSMVYDFDDYLFMGHSGHSAVFAALAAAEFAGAAFPEFVTAVAVANELEGRLGTAAAVGPHNGQMWSFIHRTGAAAAVAHILGDGARPIRDAVAAALYQFDWPTARGFMQGEAKFTTASTPTATGYRIGLFALSGGRGAARPAVGPGGCLDAYADLPLGEMLDGWGESWVTRSLSIKPHPGCAYLQSPLEGLAELREEGLAADDVESIRVHGSLPTVLMEKLSSAYREDPGAPPYSTVNTTFSVRLGLAVALLHGTFDRRALSRAAIESRRREIDELADAIEVLHDWDHTAALVRGVGTGLDLRALADERSTFEWLGALRNVRQHHDYADLPSDLGTVPSFSQLGDLAESVGPDWGDASFAFGRADFESLRLDFGATVEVKTDAGERTAEISTHRGSNAHTTDQRVAVVRDKCRRVADGLDGGPSTDSMLEAVLDEGDLSELGAWLGRPPSPSGNGG